MGDRNTERGRNREQRRRAWHRFVPFILAQRLSRHPAVHLGLQRTKRQTGGSSNKFELLAYHERFISIQAAYKLLMLQKVFSRIDA